MTFEEAQMSYALKLHALRVGLRRTPPTREEVLETWNIHGVSPVRPLATVAEVLLTRLSGGLNPG